MRAARAPGPLALRLGVATALVLSIPVIAGARAWRQGTLDLAASDAALASGNVDGAIASARRAAFAEVPLARTDRAAYARLEAIAHDAETRADQDHALRAWSAIRAAALASDGLVSRDQELGLACHALARLYIQRAREAAETRLGAPELAAAPIPDEETLARSLEDATPSFASRARRATGFTAAALLLGGIVLFFLRRGRPKDAPSPPSPPSPDTGPVASSSPLANAGATNAPSKMSR